MTGIALSFADGEYVFELGLAQIHEIQNRCKAGIGAIYARVLQGRGEHDPANVSHPAYGAYHIDDLVETVRQGLIGGKSGRVDGADVVVTPLRANELVERYALAMPLADLWNLAAAILYARIEGYAPAVEAALADKKKKRRRRVPRLSLGHG